VDPIEAQRLASKYDIGNVPGYLSYPAVAKWKQPISEGEVVELCRSANDAYLYLHFPYCQTLCTYCACYMKVTSSPKERYDEYISALEKELDLKLAEKPVVGEMHWGGGTPTYMDCDQIERIFRILDARVRWKPGATLSVEAYPDARTLTVEKLELLRRLGFSRISFGIESLDPKVLEAINRRHDLESIRHWVGAARALGFGVHVDLVYGLPYQTGESLRQTIESVLTVAPDRLASFLFLYTPTAIKHQSVIPRESVPDSNQRFGLYQILSETMAQRGYTRVGCDHWARESDPLVAAARNEELVYHFQGYEPLARRTFLGFGSSAISFVNDCYFQNRHDIQQYLAALAAGRLPLEERAALRLSDEDKLRHHLIMKSVMCDLRIRKSDVEARFGIRFDDHFRAELAVLKNMERDRLVEGVDEREIRVTEAGRTFIRNIARVFDQYYSSTSLRIAS
jgi:oxygen-independent coproporphyrinogen-3 oxidase